MAVVNMEPQPPPPENTKRQYNLEYIKSYAGIMRLFEAILPIAAIIMLSEGYCPFNTGRYGTVMFVLIVTLLEAIFIIAIMILRINETFTMVDVPLSILLNDAFLTIFHFISANLALLSIGSCDDLKAARTFGAIFILLMLVLMIAQNYLNYLQWQEKRSSKEPGKSSGMTITESSPTVLT